MWIYQKHHLEVTNPHVGPVFATLIFIYGILHCCVKILSTVTMMGFNLVHKVQDLLNLYFACLTN
jgi:hypothetical protein